jgi:hypothetical protein
MTLTFIYSYHNTTQKMYGKNNYPKYISPRNIILGKKMEKGSKQCPIITNILV